MKTHFDTLIFDWKRLFVTFKETIRFPFKKKDLIAFSILDLCSQKEPTRKPLPIHKNFCVHFFSNAYINLGIWLPISLFRRILDNEWLLTHSVSLAIRQSVYMFILHNLFIWPWSRIAMRALRICQPNTLLFQIFVETSSLSIDRVSML